MDQIKKCTLPAWCFQHIAPFCLTKCVNITCLIFCVQIYCVKMLIYPTPCYNFIQILWLQKFNNTGCPKSPLTTLKLNNLKTKSCIAKPNTYSKTRGLHNFLISNLMLELVLLETYKLNKFSGPIPKMSYFAYSHVLTDGSMLHQILFTNAGFCSIWSPIKLQKVILACCRLPWCFVLCVSCKGASLNLSAKCCALLLISSLYVLPKVHG